MTDRDPRDTAHPTMPPNYPGAQDECASCGHRRWRHKAVDGQQVCTEYVNCACGGHFVELSYGTRMARFVEAAQKVARSISTVRDALQDTMRATTELYAAMQLAGLLPEEEPAPATGKHAADRDAAVAAIAEAFDIPAEMLTGPSPDGLPDHWTGAAPLRQPAGWHTVGCDKRCGGTCMGLTADPHPIGSGPTEHHHDPEATQTIPAVRHTPSPVAELAAEVAARYCPDCSHPYSYAAEGICCMPVNAQTGLPVTGPNEPTRRCNCTTQDPPHPPDDQLTVPPRAGQPDQLNPTQWTPEPHTGSGVHTVR